MCKHKALGTEILISKLNLNIRRNVINTLLGTKCLNEQIVNFNINLVAERNTQSEDLPKIYAMNTFFLQCPQKTGSQMQVGSVLLRDDSDPPNPELLNLLAKYLKKRSVDKLIISTQKNLFDCGVFICTYVYA